MEWSSLGEIADFRAGFGFPPDLQGRDTGDYPFAKVGDISKVARAGFSTIESAAHYVDDSDLAKLKAKVLPAGSIVFAKIGEAIRQNFRAITSCPMLIDNNAMGMVPDKAKVNPWYLYYFMRTIDLYCLTDSTTVPALRKTKLETISIPLPPLPEQKRIAAILDKADAIRRKRQQAVKLTEELLRSVFLDMFGDPVTNPKGWETRAFADICETRLGKMLDAKQQTGEHLRPYLRNSNVQWDQIETSDLEQMDFDAKDRKTFSLQYGDVLICEGGEVGRAAIWRNQLTDCYFQKAIHRTRPNQSLALPEYVMFWLWFMSKNGGFKDHVTSATIAHLTGEKLKEIQMALPPITMQHEFQRIYNLLTKLKARTNKHQAETDTLFRTLLHSSFGGEM